MGAGRVDCPYGYRRRRDRPREKKWEYAEKTKRFPFAIRHSPFAIRHSPFAIRHSNPALALGACWVANSSANFRNQ
ncbi:MAG: hypothetical protein AB7N71_13460, partial [Phycisphaerae bacterium]